MPTYAVDIIESLSTVDIVDSTQKTLPFFNMKVQDGAEQSLNNVLVQNDARADAGNFIPSLPAVPYGHKTMSVEAVGIQNVKVR